jgi:hypothetical protein
MQVSKFCESDKYNVFLGMEYGLKSIPAFIFIIAGLVRYLDVRQIGVGQHLWSRMFKAKLGISILMASLAFIMIILEFTISDTNTNSSWNN